jgi:hypothetical protein
MSSSIFGLKYSVQLALIVTDSEVEGQRHVTCEIKTVARARCKSYQLGEQTKYVRRSGCTERSAMQTHASRKMATLRLELVSPICCLQ